LIAKLNFKKGVSKENNSEKVIISLAKTNPIFVCGTYKNANERDLRLLDAKKQLELLKENAPPQYLNVENQKKLTMLMNWYSEHIAFNQI
jgi:hypothetical protein